MADQTITLLVGTGIGWLSLGLGLLVCDWIRRWRRARRYGVPVNHGLLLVEYGRVLSGAYRPEDLRELLISRLPAELGIQRAAFLVPDEHRLVPVGGDDGQIPVSHAAVRWVASGGEATMSDRGQLAKLIQQSRIDLAWTRVWIPLMRGTRLRGLWLLGLRQGGLLYSPEDLRFLTSFAREVAAVLETMTHAEKEHQAAIEMRALYHQVINAREEERGRLTRELHDGVLQDLCAVTRDLKALETQARQENAPALPGESAYEDLVTRSGDTVNALRAICNNLRPPLLQQDLVAALKALVQYLDARSSAPIHIETVLGDLQLEDETALAVFRITQEALNNAIQHSGASEIAVRLTRYPNSLRLTVTDDGRGIEGRADPARFVARGHYGMAGMRERAAMAGGTLEVQTAVEYGTVVILELPLRDDSGLYQS